MLFTLAVILVVAWILGFGVFRVAGGIIHLLPVLAIIPFLWQVTGGRPLRPCGYVRV